MRVKAALQRANAAAMSRGRKNTLCNNGYLTVDVAEHKVTVNGAKLKLTPLEFRFLALLLENTGLIMSQQQVLENVWVWE